MPRVPMRRRRAPGSGALLLTGSRSDGGLASPQPGTAGRGPVSAGAHWLTLAGAGFVFTC